MAHPGLGRRAAAAVGVVGLVAGALVAFGSAPAGATTVTDEATFRAAWTNAAETQIDLAADITLTCTDGAGNGLSSRNSATAITVNGHGHTITQTCTTGTNNGVLSQAGTGALAFQNVTITAGNASGGGGGVNAGLAAVTVTNSTISNNTAGGQGGGGVVAGGDVTVTNSTISGNSVTGSGSGGGVLFGGKLTVTNSTISDNTNVPNPGGGVSPLAGGDVTVTNSTISGNSAGEGGGIQSTTGSVSVTNSTISGNTASSSGGGIAIRTGGHLTLVYATVVGNSTPSVGANLSVPVRTTLTSFGAVVALPQGGATNCALSGTTTSNGFNFSDDSSCGFSAATDRQNAGDPGLGALANNGGPTQTRLPQPGSPLIDAIPVASCQADGASGITTDQRGVTRPQGAGCDIGAVEVEVAAPPTPPGPTSAVPVEAVVRFTG